MPCFSKNRAIRSEYVRGSEGFCRLFFRARGTRVQQASDAGYIAGESSLIVQWEGAPRYDSGCRQQYFPPTMAGLKAAHAVMPR